MPTSPPPTVSILVVCWNRADDLRLCLEALMATRWPALQIVVVDNGSTDATSEVARSFPQVDVVRTDVNVGFTGGNNLGLPHVTGQYVGLVNSDAVVAPDWISGLVSCLEARPRAGAAGGKAYYWNDQHPPGDRRNPYYSYTALDPRSGRVRSYRNTPDAAREVATLSGCAVMVRRAAIDDVGPVFLEPEFFTYYEETDLFARMLARGWTLHYTGEPAVWHRVAGLNSPVSTRYLFYMHRNRILFGWRNMGPAGLAGMLRRDRWQALRDRLRLALAPVWPAPPRIAARVEARAWLAGNRALLERHRAAAPHTRDERWAEAVRRAQGGGKA